MAGSRVTELLQSRGDKVEQSPVVRGRIVGSATSTGQFAASAPTTFPIPGGKLNLLWVIAPEYAPERPLGPCWWSAEHGSTLPALNAPCVVTFDNEGVPTIVWWEGTQLIASPETITEAMLAKAVQEKLTPGPWTNPESFSAKLEETATCQVRIEQGKISARLKGFVKAKEEVAALTTIFTLPPGFRPPEVVRVNVAELTAIAVLLVYINTTGKVEVREPLKAGRLISFDGITFNLT